MFAQFFFLPVRTHFGVHFSSTNKKKKIVEICCWNLSHALSHLLRCDLAAKWPFHKAHFKYFRLYRKFACIEIVIHYAIFNYRTAIASETKKSQHDFFLTNAYNFIWRTLLTVHQSIQWVSHQTFKQKKRMFLWR